MTPFHIALSLVLGFGVTGIHAEASGGPVHHGGPHDGLAFGVTGIRGEAGGRAVRHGGPHDWSHGRVIATKFGPDLDANIGRDWRTSMKHAQLDLAHANRTAHSDWLATLLKPAKQVVKANGSKLDWNLATGGYGSVVGSPAKYSFDVTASSCNDVIYFTVDQTGAASTVNVIGITNAYAGCAGNVAGATPTVKFGLATVYGTPTSAVPSLDGKILYVLESRPSANGGVVLHAINVNNILVIPGVYNFVTSTWAGARALAAPTGLPTSEQLFEIAFAGVDDTAASPYLDYATNQMFFGDSTGAIHRIANVNTAAAAEDTANFPVQCGGDVLQSPVFVNGQIITTSADGSLYRIDTTLPPPYTCIASYQGGAGTGAGVGGGLSAPVIDVSNGKIIVVSNQANGYSLRGLGIWPLMFRAGDGPLSAVSLGAASSTIAPQAPSFDEAFWSTNNGNIYAPGAPSSGDGTYLIRVPYNGTTLGAPSGFATLTSSGVAQTVETSPVTEFLTASSLANPDFVFVGGGSGNYTYINRISSGFGGADGAPAAMAGSFQPVGGGGVTSGIVIDTRTTKVTGSTATANVYFGTVGVPSTTQSRIVQLAQQF
jgi:hypothetical protein